MNKNIRALAQAKAGKGGGNKEPGPRHFLTSTVDTAEGNFSQSGPAARYTKGAFRESGEGSPIIHTDYRWHMPPPDKYGGSVIHESAENLKNRVNVGKPKDRWVERVRDQSPMYRKRH